MPVTDDKKVIPLFSWWNSHKEDNFASSDPRWAMPLESIQHERFRILNGRKQEGYGLYRLEGMILDPNRPKPTGTVPLYSWWNKDRNDNFATTNPEWNDGSATKKEGYSKYRLEGYLFDPSSPCPEGCLPVCSWWNAERTDNFLTADPAWNEGTSFGDKKGGYTKYRLEGHIAAPPEIARKEVIYRAYVATEHGVDYSRAAVGLESQFGDRDGQLSMRDKGHRFRMHGVDSGGPNRHYQGIGFLRDTLMTAGEGGTRQKVRRSVLSYNAGKGLTISAGNIDSQVDDGAVAWDQDRRVRFQDHRVDFDVRDEPRWGNHPHPGGLQAHGDMIAVAMEGEEGNERVAAVYFIRVDGMQPRFVNSFALGSGGAPAGLNINSAAASGFLKLESGFLVAVSGATHGTGGIWFYSTPDEQISETTSWRFLDFWTPDAMPKGICKISDGKYSNDCYVGAGGGVSLLAGDNGSIYMVVTTGTDDAFGKDDEYAQLYRVHVNPTLADNRVRLECLWTDKKKLGHVATSHFSMRWSGAAQTTLDGRVFLLNSERGATKGGRRTTGSRSATDGVLRISEN